MPLNLMVILTGILYVLGFGALSFVRQQGISIHFLLEGLIITISGALMATFFPVHPVLFLAVLYLITMRVRLMIDLANWFTLRKNYRQAFALYGLARRLALDRVSQMLILINIGIAKLYMRDYEVAYGTLKGALTGEKAPTKAAKYLAAGYYNLGIACRRTGRETEATMCFNQAVEVLPKSFYARAAERALKESRSSKK